MTAFQIDREFVNTFRKNADASQPPHIGFDMNRIDALFVRIEVENICQLSGNVFKIKMLKRSK
jgi:hypothetical protein